MDNPRTQHKKQKFFKCEFCGKSFNTTGALKVHLIIHNGERALDESEKGFNQSQQMNEQRKIHIKQKAFKCEECGKSFLQLSQLKFHESKHSGQYRLKCEVCGKGFNTFSHFEIHKRIHNGEKPFKCEECGRGFSEKGSLKVHKRTHSAEKPYKCQECGRSFIQLGNFKRHKQIHTGEKKFECGYCGKRFTQSHHLNKHKQVHNENQTKLFSKQIRDNPFSEVKKESPFDLNNDSNANLIVSSIKIEPEEFGTNEDVFQIESSLKHEDDIKIETPDN